MKAASPSPVSNSLQMHDVPSLNRLQTPSSSRLSHVGIAARIVFLAFQSFMLQPVDSDYGARYSRISRTSF